MYKGKRIEELISHKKMMKKDFVEAMGWSGNKQLYQVIDGNPTASNLEKIADFFGVPVDYFFEREGFPCEDIDVPSAPAEASVSTTEVRALKALLEEKDKRISILEKYISLLEQGQNRDTKDE